MSRKLDNAYRAKDVLEAPRPHGFVSFDGQDYFVRKGYRLVPCEGEAHRNPHIDNCSRCAPLWGVVAVEDD